MNRNECWMATCLLVLVVAVNVGQAQEKQPKTAPQPKILYIQTLPPSPEVALQVADIVLCVSCRIHSHFAPSLTPVCLVSIHIPHTRSWFLPDMLKCRDGLMFPSLIPRTEKEIGKGSADRKLRIEPCALASSQGILSEVAPGLRAG